MKRKDPRYIRTRHRRDSGLFLSSVAALPVLGFTDPDSQDVRTVSKAGPDRRLLPDIRGFPVPCMVKTRESRKTGINRSNFTLGGVSPGAWKAVNVVGACLTGRSTTLCRSPQGPTTEVPDDLPYRVQVRVMSWRKT